MFTANTTNTLRGLESTTAEILWLTTTKKRTLINIKDNNDNYFEN